MKVGDLVISATGSQIGIVSKIWKDPAWKDLQAEVLWAAGFWSQYTINTELLSVISENR